MRTSFGYKTIGVPWFSMVFSGVSRLLQLTTITKYYIIKFKINFKELIISWKNSQEPCKLSCLFMTQKARMNIKYLQGSKELILCLFETWIPEEGRTRDLESHHRLKCFMTTPQCWNQLKKLYGRHHNHRCISAQCFVHLLLFHGH